MFGIFVSRNHDKLIAADTSSVVKDRKETRTEGYRSIFSIFMNRFARKIIIIKKKNNVDCIKKWNVTVVSSQQKYRDIIYTKRTRNLSL